MVEKEAVSCNRHGSWRARVHGLLLAIALPGLLTIPSEARAEEGRYCAALPDGGEICLLREVEGYYWEWFQVAEDGTARRIPHSPMATLSASAISLSPSGRWVAALGADEGHPVVAVVELEPLLAGREGKGLVRGLYPGWLGLLCWQGEALVLSSDQDLLGDWHSMELEIGPGGLFLLRPESGRIERPAVLRCEKPIG